MQIGDEHLVGVQVIIKGNGADAVFRPWWTKIT